MRILLAQNLIHLPSHGGANRSDRLLMEELAARGHDCRAVTPLTGALATLPPGPSGGTGANGADPAVAALTTRGAVVLEDTREAVVYRFRGVTVHAVRHASALPGRIRDVAGDLRPDWTLVPSDDPGHVVFGAALAATPDRVVHLVHTLQQLPCGPGAFYPSEAGTRLLRRAARTVAVSRAAQRYVAEHGGIHAEVVHPQVYGDARPPRRGGFGSGAVAMVNPCGYKGIQVLLGLADALPGTRFLAVPTWGTEPADRAELRRRPNIEVMDPVDDIDEVFRRTGVLLMPSLWDETFGYTCVEAMLRGIPVLASDVPGLLEAKLGVPGSLPVRRITRYAARAGQARPAPVVPTQDLGPWLAALRSLLTSRRSYEEQADASCAAAAGFVDGLDPGALERCLAGAPAHAPAPHYAAASGPGLGAAAFDRASAIRLLVARRAASGGTGAVEAVDRKGNRPC